MTPRLSVMLFAIHFRIDLAFGAQPVLEIVAVCSTTLFVKLVRATGDPAQARLLLSARGLVGAGGTYVVGHVG